MKIPAQVGEHSLIGTMGEPPFSHGNYFWFSNGMRSVNMWAENLYDLVDRSVLEDGYINVDVYEVKGKYWAIVTDERVPDEYLINYPCFTGGPVPPKGLLLFMSKYYEWDYERVEEYVDPESYAKKRGGYISNGVMVIPVNTQAKRLRHGWTLKIN